MFPNMPLNFLLRAYTHFVPKILQISGYGSDIQTFRSIIVIISVPIEFYQNLASEADFTCLGEFGFIISVQRVSRLSSPPVCPSTFKVMGPSYASLAY